MEYLQNSPEMHFHSGKQEGPWDLDCDTSSGLFWTFEYNSSQNGLLSFAFLKSENRFWSGAPALHSLFFCFFIFPGAGGGVGGGRGVPLSSKRVSVRHPRWRCGGRQPSFQVLSRNVCLRVPLVLCSFPFYYKSTHIPSFGTPKNRKPAWGGGGGRGGVR